jgi:hypothetical protein
MKAKVKRSNILVPPDAKTKYESSTSYDVRYGVNYVENVNNYFQLQWQFCQLLAVTISFIIKNLEEQAYAVHNTCIKNWEIHVYEIMYSYM